MNEDKQAEESRSKPQSDNYSPKNLFNVDLDGDINNIIQYVHNIVQEVPAPAPFPEADMEQLTNALKTNRSSLKEKRDEFNLYVIKGEFVNKVQFATLIRNIVTYIKNIEKLIPDITFKGGVAQFEEGETDPVTLIENIMSKVEKIKEKIIIKKICCPHCNEDQKIEDGKEKLILSIDECSQGFFSYGECKTKDSINKVAVDKAVKETCDKCGEKYCVYVASKSSLAKEVKNRFDSLKT
jgi:hypothetical protein